MLGFQLNKLVKMYTPVANLIMIYSILRRRGSNHKWLYIGFRQIYWAIEFAFHAYMDERFKRNSDINDILLFESGVEISCDTYTGIKLNLDYEPIVYLDLVVSGKIQRNVSIVNIPIFAKIRSLTCMNMIIDKELTTRRVHEVSDIILKQIERLASIGDTNMLMSYSEL